MIDELAGTKAQAKHLVLAGLWSEGPEGYAFVGWHKYQPTRAEVEEGRKKESERKAKWRLSRGDTAGTPPSVPLVSQQVSGHPDPTRPDPALLKDMSSGAEPDPPKKSPIKYPPDFVEWWSVYPRRESKGAALTAFRKAIKTVELPVLIGATQAYALSNIGNDPQFVKLPAGWLNDRKWEDEKPVAVVSSRSFVCTSGHSFPDGPYCVRCGERQQERDF